MKRNKKKIIRAVTVSRSCGFFHEILFRMREQEYDMVVLSSPGPELNEISKEGFHTIAIPMERHISIVKDFKSLLLLIKAFLKEKPEMVHSMTPKAGLLCMIAAWTTRVPLRVHTFTGLVWPTAQGLQRKVLMVTDKLTCACATHIIPEGHGVLDDLRNGGITKKPMRVLGFGNVRGVDIQRFDPARFNRNTPKDIFTYVFVGRIVGDKGINELVEAFTALQEQNKNTRLVFVGEKESDLNPLNDVTENLIATNENIILTGKKTGDDLVQEYANADCFVMPSYREGFPNTVLEAGAMGIPSIVTDINGSREIIVNGENGLIVPSKNSNKLYEAMNLILTDHSLRQQMADKARQMIISRFEKKFVQQCLIDFYEGILK